MQIFYSPEFCKEYKKLPQEIKDKAKEKEKILAKYPFDKRLKTHKLQGKLNDYWAFSIDYKYRIVFGFHTENIIRFYAIGTHSIYK